MEEHEAEEEGWRERLWGIRKNRERENEGTIDKEERRKVEKGGRRVTPEGRGGKEEGANR